MSHSTPLNKSQLRHVDEYTPGITYADLDHEGQARHVDEYRHAQLHDDEESESGDESPDESS